MSGTYHSRVFTFINKQANELKNSCNKGLRHIKVAVVWSGQVLFYPIHLLAQTVKSLQNELPAPSAQKSLPTPPLAPDINIERVLDAIASVGYPIEIASPVALTQADRQSSDLLKWHPDFYQTSLATDEDEEDWELAAATPNRFRQAIRTKPIVRGLSSLLIDRQLVLVTTDNKLLDILTISQQQEIRRRIGVDLSINWHRWQTNNLPQSQHHQELLADCTPTAQLTIASAENLDRSPNIIDRFRNWWQENYSKSSDLDLVNSPQLPAKAERHSPAQLAPAAYSFTPQPPNSSRFINLPQLPPIFETPTSTSPENPIVTTIVKLQPDWLKQWLNYYRDYLYIPAQDEDLQLVHQSTKFELIPLAQPSETIINSAIPEKNKFRDMADRDRQSIEQSSGKLSKQSFQNLEYHPDWIETDAETIGFDRSPVAKILDWLDKLMLKIENWLIKIWNLITNQQIEY